ncbi:unnamed protein product [Rotaria sordida]|uniref:Carbonic anhydrase n=1 Tax=Rotaria sordida TaxID=392033 RepID=A0A814KII1_9BILA|nr:unnamed protein product [Rotaria sordida]
MCTNDILLAAALDSSNVPPAKSFIDNCCTNNVKFTQTYDENIYDNGVIPSKHLVIICCMDARLDIFRMLGLQPGEAHIIRNGGGRIRDAVRSLICSQTLFQTKELMIIHHTDCGFTYFSSNDQILASLMVQTGTLKSNLILPRSRYQFDKSDFMPVVDIEQSIRDDLAEYKQYPMLNQNIIRRQSLTLDISPIGTVQIGVRSSSKIRPLNDDKFSSATTFDHHSLPRKRSSKRSSIVTHSLNINSYPSRRKQRKERRNFGAPCRFCTPLCVTWSVLAAALLVCVIATISIAVLVKDKSPITTASITTLTTISTTSSITRQLLQARQALQPPQARQPRQARQLPQARPARQPPQQVR